MDNKIKNLHETQNFCKEIVKKKLCKIRIEVFEIVKKKKIKFENWNKKENKRIIYNCTQFLVRINFKVDQRKTKTKITRELTKKYSKARKIKN